MNAPAGKATGSGMFKHYDTRYMAWLKETIR